MTTVHVNGVALGIESFGAPNAPLVLLVGAPTMLSWPDALCERLAVAGRRVVRYDLRDSGESTTTDPGAPAYTLRDLAADAAALVGALGGKPRTPCGDRRRWDGRADGRARPSGRVLGAHPGRHPRGCPRSDRRRPPRP